MSPVARRQGPGHTGKAVAVASVGVIVALGVAFLVANLASRGDVEVRLGDDRFNAGDAVSMLERIEEDGAPILYQDPARFSRPIHLDNTGDDPDAGWVALLAVVPDEPACALNWDRDEELYVSTCDDSVTYPRSGEGLRAYDVVLEAGKVFVELRDADQ